jgi:hypothetical protein
MGIYVSISVLSWDTELPTTVLSCLQNSSGKNNIEIGVAYIADQETFDFQMHHMPGIQSIENVRIKRFPFEEYWGIGRGRNAAISMYSRQDYFLQVDAHTYFRRNWDETLIKKYHEAEKMTNNEKTVLTGIPEMYWYPEHLSNHIDFNEEQPVGYPYWMTGWWWVEDCVPRWAHRDPTLLTNYLADMVKNTSFAPAIKISGAFMFGRGHLAGHLRLNEKFVFWEEEIIQSIELIDKGFTLVYPYMANPMHHMYVLDSGEEYGPRAHNDIELKKANIHLDLKDATKKNMADYFQDPRNASKILRYQDYAGVYLGDATTKRYFKSSHGVRRHQYAYINAK